MVDAYTDLPFPEFGDPSPRSMREDWEAPIRRVEVLSWDRDKRCCVRVFQGDEVIHVQVKRWYLYREAKRQEGVGYLIIDELEGLPESCGDDCPYFRERYFDTNYHRLHNPSSGAIHSRDIRKLLGG